MSFHIYKPNSKNTGCAFNFYLTKNKNGNEPVFLIGAIKQFSWNDKTKTGSFEKNKGNPEKVINVKFTEFEAGEMLSCLRRRYEWSTIHRFEDNQTTISLSPWDKEKKVFDKVKKEQKFIKIPAFGILLSRNGAETFRIPLEPGEVERLISFLTNYLKQLDDIRYNNHVKNK